MMSEFSEFLREKNELSETKAIHWKNEKSEWINTVQHFMDQVSGWVDDERQSGLIDVEKSKVSVTEEELGDYEAPALRMKAGNMVVHVTPVARLVVGATGRIDVYGEYSKYIVLNHKDKGWVYRREGQGGAFKNFNKEAFLEMVMEIIS